MKQRKTEYGFALLNVLLGITLLTGIIFLIMHAMTSYHSEENARAIGEELAPIMVKLLVESDLASKDDGSYALVTQASTTPASPCATKAALLTTIPSGYLQSLKVSGFDLSYSACVDIA